MKQILLFGLITCLHCVGFSQNLQLFDLKLIGDDERGFFSLSEVYTLSEHEDSIAIPDLSAHSQEEAAQFEQIKLEDHFRDLFLLKTGISELDTVYVFDYKTNFQLTFCVKDLTLTASLTPYGADWPYTQLDYLIGFEIEQKHMVHFGYYPQFTFVYVGKENPFQVQQMKQIVWKPTDKKSFSTFALKKEYISIIKKNYYYETSRYYTYSADGLAYFIHEYDKGSATAARHLIVVNEKTGSFVRDYFFHEDEGTSPAPLDEQWTGKLMKYRSPVIFGFNYVSFGCPSLISLDPVAQDVYIYCDNRH